MRFKYDEFAKFILIALSVTCITFQAEARKVTVGVKPGLHFDPKVLHV